MIQETIQHNLDQVEEKILGALAKKGRKREEIKLIVVSKAQPLEKMLAAYDCGVRLFGENYPEETAGKIENFANLKDIEWHMIGHLQSRKARIVAASFHMLHSLDGLHTAEKLENLLAEKDRILPVLIEINTGGEESKSGLDYHEGIESPAIYEFVAQLKYFKHLAVHGLMTMPPLWNDPERSRPYFKNLRLLREDLAKEFPDMDWQELSMGTSGDFETAIEEGSTMIRIGHAILGERSYNKQT
ncbi:MAG: YggS family pyridoxal phosphate-dependent enzyme [Anaerolineaceae bacterium]